MRDIVELIEMYLFEIDEPEQEPINERLRIYTEDNISVPRKTYKLQFNKRNVQKIANDWDAKIEVFDKDLKSARLKDNAKGRLIFVDGS